VVGRWVICLSLVACGRVGFQLENDGAVNSDAAPLPNYAFVTSTLQLPTTFGADLSGADAICNMRATEAHLPGTYVAWLSTTTINARDRLAVARGWIRTDGKPFADRIEDIVANEIFYPLNRDENGIEVAPDHVLTGTNDMGQLFSPNCADYSSSTQMIYFGVVEATAHGWTDESTVSCAMPARIYCFGISVSQPVSVVPAVGRIAFLTSQTFVPDAGGLTTADNLCANEATLGNLTGTYRAFLATTTASAISRVSLTGATWVRTDGVPLASSPQDLANGVLTAPLNVTSTQTYRIANAYGGATSATATSTGGAQNCADWTNTSTTAVVGLPSYATSQFFFSTSPPNRPCSGVTIYCLEQ
jgi:hypothetical protein